MLIEELVVQYEAYSDKELYSVYSKIGDYSDEAKAALDIVIKRKGGIEIIKSHLASQARIEAEIIRIKNETTQLSKPGTDSGFIKKLIKSEILPQEKVDEIMINRIDTAVILIAQSNR